MKFTKKTVTEVDYADLEQLIEDTYGHKIELVADQEWCNDTDHCVFIDKGPLDDHSKQQVGQFRRIGKHRFAMYPLLQDMCNNGVLQSGEYLISVCW